MKEESFNLKFKPYNIYNTNQICKDLIQASEYIVSYCLNIVATTVTLGVTLFYCENHEPSLPPFVGRLPEFQGTWSEEPTPLDLPQVVTLTNQINLLKEQGLTRVCVATHWLARGVLPLKKQVHPSWEYSGLQDPTQVTNEKVAPELLVKHLEEMFQDTSSWPTDVQVCSYHIRVERDQVRHPDQYNLSFSS
jgi:hypothetical protein